MLFISSSLHAQTTESSFESIKKEKDILAELNKSTPPKASSPQNKDITQQSILQSTQTRLAAIKTDQDASEKEVIEAHENLQLITDTNVFVQSYKEKIKENNGIMTKAIEEDIIKMYKNTVLQYGIKHPVSQYAKDQINNIGIEL